MRHWRDEFECISYPHYNCRLRKLDFTFSVCKIALEKCNDNKVYHITYDTYRLDGRDWK